MSRGKLLEAPHGSPPDLELPALHHRNVLLQLLGEMSPAPPEYEIKRTAVGMGPIG